MAGKYHYTISANYSNVEADSVEELKGKLRDFINDEELPVLLAQYHAITRPDALSVPQAVANVQAQIPATVAPQTIDATPAQVAVPAASAVPTAAPVVAAPAQVATAAAPAGPDGRPRIAKSGVSAKGPWKAWMTQARKGEVGYDEPIWVRRGTPEWDSFPI